MEATKPVTLAYRAAIEVEGPNGETATLKRIDRGTWFMRADNDGAHSRWGNAAEIAEDATFFERTGRLPHARGYSWS